MAEVRLVWKSPSSLHEMSLTREVSMPRAPFLAFTTHVYNEMLSRLIHYHYLEDPRKLGVHLGSGFDMREWRFVAHVVVHEHATFLRL